MTYTSRGTSQGLSDWFYEIPHGLWAGGGIQTTADEVARWLIALSKGQLIIPASLQRMWTPEKLASGADGEWGQEWQCCKPGRNDGSQVSAALVPPLSFILNSNLLS